MAQPKWNGTNQNWTTAADWSTNPAIPQPGDDVTIAQGDPQITSNVGSVNSVLDSATLSIESGGALTTTAGFTNIGTLGIDDGSGGANSRLTVGTTLVNSGTINIDNFYPGGGSALTVTGKLTDTGHVNFGATNLTTASTMTLGDLDVTNGTLAVTGNTTASSTASATVTVTASVAATLDGTIDLTGDAVLSYGGGAMTTIGSNGNPTSGTLILDGAKAQLVVKGRTGNENGLSLANVYGGLYLRDGATYTTPGALVVTGLLGIDDTAGAGKSSLTVNGALTNSGHIAVANFFPNGGSSLVVTGKVTDTGSIVLGATNLVTSITASFGDLSLTGGSLSILGNTTQGTTIKASVAVTASVAAALNGAISLQGDATLTFGGGSITSIGATGSLTLDGAAAQLSATGASGNESGVKLAAVYNNFYLRDGATYTTPGALTVTGTLGLDDIGGAAGSSLTVSGALTNSGHINVANFFPNGGSSLIVTGKVTDTNAITFGATNLQTSITAQFGDLNVTGGTLSILGNTTQGTSAAASVTVTASVAAALNGTIAIQGDASLTYGGGSITSIGAGGTLTLDGAGAQLKVNGKSGNESGVALATVYNNFSLRNGATYTTPGALTVTGTLGLDDIGGAAGSSMTVSGALTNSGHIYIDNYFPNGGTAFTVSGKLTDTGTVTFGATNLQTSSTVMLGDLDVTGGTFSVLGNTMLGTSAMASATVTAAVAATLNGTINITGDAALTYGGGAIATIGTAGALVLDGASAQLTVTGKSGATSGLALGTVNGTFAVRDGATYATPGALAVSGILDIDDTSGSGGSSLTVTGALTLASAGRLYMDNYFASGNSSLTVTGKLTDAGQVNFGSTSLQNAGTIQLGDLDVTGGTFNITGNTTLGSPAMASVNVTAAVAAALNGSISLLGDAALTFGGGSIKSIGASGALSIDGPSAQIGVTGGSGNTSALALASNAGKLTLADGVVASTPGALTNSGTLTLSGGSSLAVGGALTSSGALSVDATSTLTVQGGFQQGPGTLALTVTGNGLASTVTVTGGLSLLGGTLNVALTNGSAAPGTIDLITFKAGALSGIFGAVSFANVGGDSTTITLGNNLLAGVVYGDAAGTIELDVVTAPATLVDTWAGGTGSWSTGSNWSADVPTFYSQVAIGGSTSGKVTLSTDATIDSLSIGASSSLATTSGTELAIGSALSIVSGAALTVGGQAFVGRNVTNAGAVALTASTVLDVLGASSGTGGYNIGAGARLQFGGSVSNAVNFYGAGSKLVLGNGGAFSGTLQNFAAGDTADLIGVGIAVAGSPSTFTTTGEETVFTATSSGGTLRLVNTLNGNATLATYALSGSYGSGVFTLTSDGGAGTLLGFTPTVALGLAAGNVVTSNIPGSAALAVVDKYNSDGSLNQEYTLTKLANGNYDYHYAGGSFFSGKSFAAFDNVVTPAGTLVTQTQYNSAGKVIEGSQYNANGSLYEQYTVSTLSNGNIDYHYQNGTFFNGKPFQSFDNITNASGTLLSQTLYDSTGFGYQQTQFNANGSIYLQDTVSKPASGQLLYHYAGGSFFTGKSFSAFDNLATTGGTLLDQILYNNDGSHTFTVPGSNLTLTAQKNDTFNVTGSTETTRFNATGFGTDLFKGYASGDIFSFSTSIFANYTALSQHVSGTSSAVITTSANDTLTLNGVAANSLNSSMFKFS